MTTTEIIAAALTGLLLPPLLIILGKKAGCSKSVKNVIVTCPACNTSLKLKTMRNYKCPKCHEEVIFFDVKTGKPHKDAIFIHCSQCNTSNFEGMMFCHKCEAKLPLPEKKETLSENNNAHNREKEE